MKKVRSILVLLVFIGVLIWCINGDPVAITKDKQGKEYGRRVLRAELIETIMELEEQGVRVSGGYVSSKYNVAVVSVDPWDAGKLQLIQNGVPDIKLLRLVRMGEEIPVYVELEFHTTYTHPVGLN